MPYIRSYVLKIYTKNYTYMQFYKTGVYVFKNNFVKFLIQVFTDNLDR